MAVSQQASQESSNVIAITAALIGLVSAVGSGQLGLEHAIDLVGAGSANLGDFLTVAATLWNVFPIGAVTAVVAGLLAHGTHVPIPQLWYGGIPLIGLAAAAVGAEVDPNRHLQHFYQIAYDTRNTPSFLEACVKAYGLLSCVLAGIAGTGAGIAAGIKLR